MKKIFIILISLILGQVALSAAESDIIIATDNTELVLRIEPNGRLYQVYYGDRLLDAAEYCHISHGPEPFRDGSIAYKGWEVAPGYGSETHSEPMLAITHNDGNPSTYLYYDSHVQYAVDGGIQTDIALSDDQYPVELILHYVAYTKEDVIKTWTEIRHKEKKPVKLWRYASSVLYFRDHEYFVTDYSGDWCKESNMSTQKLEPGKRIIESTVGCRTAIHTGPYFTLGIDEPARENSGKVMMGTLAWSGNFQFSFEVDQLNNLRLVSTINPYASDYELEPGRTFVTPEFIFTWSDDGMGEASRNIHDWARNYQLKNGKGPRMTLLNNWESTSFHFNEEILSGLMHEAKKLGIDMFLLDDGWFGNNHPRVHDDAGLGDWEVMKSKLPNGIPGLIRTAKEAGVKLGLWLEPEMVNPKSDLFEKHPDWAILLPNREPFYHRNQLVLDMSNPKVQDYVFGVIDRILTENPELSFFKWDCNTHMTNIYSPYLKEKQSNLYIDHTFGVMSVFERIKSKYPDLQMMMCSGGGGRNDYNGLKYFGEYWCSDNSDAIERLFIQWGQSHFFPAKAMCAHVTEFVANPTKQVSVKFRMDVSSMCKLGFDFRLSKHTEDEISFCREGVANWKRLSPVILDGDQYRLVSPYEGNHMSVMYASKDKNNAVLFTYDIYPRFHEFIYNVKLQGLDPQKKYMVKELNLMPGKNSNLPENGKIYSGDYLMKVGLKAFTERTLNSRMIELIAQ